MFNIELISILLYKNLPAFLLGVKNINIVWKEHQLFKWVFAVLILMSSVVASQEQVGLCSGFDHCSVRLLDLESVESLPPESTEGVRVDSDCDRRIVEFLDLESMGRLSRASKAWGAAVRPVIADTKQWVKDGGLLRALFLADANEEDRSVLGRFDCWSQPIEGFRYQDFLQLLTCFTSLDLDNERLERLTAELIRVVDENSTLTSTQKEFLGMWMPNKNVGEMASNLSMGIMSGDCECGNGVYSSACTCWSRLYSEDLRNITPRILHEWNEITSSDSLIVLNAAFFSGPWSILLTPESLHPMPELRGLLIAKMQEELATNQRNGVDLIRMSVLFLMLGRGAEADESFFKIVQDSDGAAEHVASVFLYAMYKVTLKPFVFSAKAVYGLLHHFGFVA